MDEGVFDGEETEVGIKVEDDGEEVILWLQAEIEAIIPNITTNVRNLFVPFFTMNSPEKLHTLLFFACLKSTLLKNDNATIYSFIGLEIIYMIDYSLNSESTFSIFNWHF